MTETAAKIEWARIAEPQEDGYDSRVALALAQDGGLCPTDIGGVEPTFADGNIALTQDPILNGFEGCRPAALEHPNVATAEQLLRIWSVGFEQCKMLLHSIGLSESDALGQDQVVGSICGPGSYGFGSIAVTVNHHMGLAEGIVHEMAHHKLQAIGVGFESASRLVANPTSAQFPSPIRYDCLRPMTAVLHAQYSYTYIANLDLAVVEHDTSSETRKHAVVEHSLAVIIPKLAFGLTVLKDEWIRDADGEEFARGLFDWCERVVGDGERILSETCVQPVAFQHPLG
ncbi:MAG: HEXXH motif-containing putative peptide modification protein [Pirellulales bacterium]|nr:HEXXH motif-containing putative peptide modification protein [Pirellulales bacterium]